MSRHPDGVPWSEGDVLRRRIGAVLLDTLLIIVPAAVLAARGTDLDVGTTAFGLYIFHVVFLVWFVYGLWFEWIWGQTLGKMVFGIVVVRENGSRLTFGAAFTRNFMRYFDLLLYYVVGYVAIKASDRSQRIGDWLAKTVVVRAA